MSQEIVDRARSWIGTKFKHQGRIKKSNQDAGGCDCLGLIMGLDIITKNGKPLKLFDQHCYPKLLTSNILLDQLNLLLESTEITRIQVGDLLLLRVNNWPQHLAIISAIDPITIIHSYIQVRKIIEQHLSEEWKKNIVAIYKI